MYVYINFAVAEKAGKIKRESLTGWFKFQLDNGQEIGGHTTEGRAHLDCKIVPEEVKPYYISCSERIIWEVQAHRYTGVYKLGTAVGTLEFKRGVDYNYGHEGFDVHHEYVLEVESEGFEDCHELVQQVRAGTVLPIENWEAPQVQKPNISGFFQKLRVLFGKGSVQLS